MASTGVDVGWVVGAALDIASGMQQLYDCDPPIAHRDLKSANVLVTGENRCVISDFGISKSMSTLGTATKNGSIAGTGAWMSPENLRNQVDWTKPAESEKCDVWSIGVIMFIMMAGYPPFYGDKDAVILGKVRKVRGRKENPSVVFELLMGLSTQV